MEIMGINLLDVTVKGCTFTGRHHSPPPAASVAAAAPD